MDIDDVDAEAEAASSAEDGAHRLAYLEAVFHVVYGYYLVPLNDAIILAGLILVSLKGKMPDAERAAIEGNPRHHLESYRAHLPEVIAAQSIAEHKATSGKGVDDLVVRGYVCVCVDIDPPARSLSSSARVRRCTLPVHRRSQSDASTCDCPPRWSR